MGGGVSTAISNGGELLLDDGKDAGGVTASTVESGCGVGCGDVDVGVDTKGAESPWGREMFGKVVLLEVGSSGMTGVGGTGGDGTLDLVEEN